MKRERERERERKKQLWIFRQTHIQADAETDFHRQTE